MYLYFNAKGVLEEVVNDIPTRKDSSNVNHIYVYIEGISYDDTNKYYPLPSTITSLSTKYQLPDGTITPTALVSAKVKSTIPYDKHRDMKCFKDFYTYEFFDIELPSGVNEDGSQSEIPNVLGQSGLVALTIIEQPVGLALGLVVFNVEKEVGITTDTLITEAQFNYLMGYIADYKKKIDESVQANINKVDGLSKVTPANNLALYQLTNLMSTYNGAYARRIKDNIIFANNNVYKFTDTGFTPVQDNVITDSDAIEIANIQPNYFDNFVVLTYRVKLANGNYEIRARITSILDAGNLYHIGDYKTIDANSSYGLYEPFTLILSNTTAYVIYSRENNLSNQDIVARKITFNTTNNTITEVGEDIIMVSGTNQKDDEGEVIDNSRPGFAIVDKLIDGSYLMVFESNINNDRTDYPYVVQYIYFKDIENSKTYTTPQTLFKVKFANVNIPYLAIKNDGRVVMTYHSTGNYYGANGDNLGIHKKVFEAVESNRVITYGTELTRNDFVNIPLYDNKENQWSGAWGSTFIYNDKPYFMYVIGTNTETSSSQNNFVVANIEPIPEKSVNATPNTIMLRDNNGASYVQTPSNPASTNIVNIAYLYKYTSDYVTGISSVEVTNNSLVKRSSSGIIYGATPTDTNPNNEPKAVVNKEYIGNVVEPIEEEITNKVNKISTIEKAGSIAYGRSSVGTEEGVNYRSSAQYGSDLIYRDANGRAEIKDPVNDLDIANKEYVDTTINQKLASTYVYKGSVQTYADLPTDTDIGDVYNVIEAYQSYPAGTNFAWTGTQWDALGGSVDLSNYATKQEVANDLSSKLDKVSTTGTSNRIYAIAPNGSQYTPKLTNSVVSGEVTVPIRDTNGNFKVGTPKVDGDASNKKYVDDSVSTKADKKESGNFLYGGNVVLIYEDNKVIESSFSEKIYATTSNHNLNEITLMYTFPKNRQRFKGSKHRIPCAYTKYGNNKLAGIQTAGGTNKITLYSDKYETTFNVSDVMELLFGKATKVTKYIIIEESNGKKKYTSDGKTFVDTIEWKPDASTSIQIDMKFNRNINNMISVPGYSFSLYEYSEKVSHGDLPTFFFNMSSKIITCIRRDLGVYPTSFQIKFVKNYEERTSATGNDQGWTGTMANIFLNLSIMIVQTSDSQDGDEYSYIINPRILSFKSKSSLKRRINTDKI